jgi:hypothetical protein
MSSSISKVIATPAALQRHLPSSYLLTSWEVKHLVLHRSLPCLVRPTALQSHSFPYFVRPVSLRRETICFCSSLSAFLCATSRNPLHCLQHPQPFGRQPTHPCQLTQRASFCITHSLASGNSLPHVAPTSPSLPCLGQLAAPRSEALTTHVAPTSP